MSALHALRAMIRNILPGLLLTGLACAQPADPLPAGGITLTDDIGRTVRLEAPARRIVSLAPHITEILYAAGAGEYLVGAVEFSDYPEAARALPRVGSYAKYDLEAIAALKPDLIVAWESSLAARHITHLKALRIPLFVSKPRQLDDVARSIERLGELAGTQATASMAAKAFRSRHAELQKRYAGRAPVRVFYQIWNQPLSTVNGEQLISDVMRLCGAENIFAQLTLPAPIVTIEAILVANPEAIVASAMDGTRPTWLDMWSHWRDLTATRRNNLFFIPADLINRHSPRILDGATRMCEQMDKVRSKRPGTRPATAQGPANRPHSALP